MFFTSRIETVSGDLLTILQTSSAVSTGFVLLIKVVQLLPDPAKPALRLWRGFRGRSRLVQAIFPLFLATHRLAFRARANRPCARLADAGRQSQPDQAVALPNPFSPARTRHVPPSVSARPVPSAHRERV